MAHPRILVTDMGAVYRLSRTNWRKWLRDFKSSGEKPDISDAHYFAECLTYVHHDVTDWTRADLEWLNPDEEN